MQKVSLAVAGTEGRIENRDAALTYLVVDIDHYIIPSARHLLVRWKHCSWWGGSFASRIRRRVRLEAATIWDDRNISQQLS